MSDRVLRAVLLDVDGTLVDSNDAHAYSWADALAALGYEKSFEDVRPLIGMGGDNLLPTLIGIESESEEGKRLSDRKREIFERDYLQTIRPFPRVQELIDRMRADGLSLVVASSANEEELEALLRIAGAESLIADSTSADDAENSKPDPDIIHAALARAKADARECILLGDTPYDVEAAQRAGVRVVGVRCGGWDDAALRGAIAVYDDPADLLARYEESPIARGVSGAN